MRTRGQEIAHAAIHEGMTEYEIAEAIDTAIRECMEAAKASEQPVSSYAGDCPSGLRIGSTEARQASSLPRPVGSNPTSPAPSEQPDANDTNVVSIKKDEENCGSNTQQPVDCREAFEIAWKVACDKDGGWSEAAWDIWQQAWNYPTKRESVSPEVLMEWIRKTVHWHGLNGLSVAEVMLSEFQITRIED